jgi:transcriptional regulator with XRE-family HTH domain
MAIKAKTISARIKFYRDMAGLSQQALADFAGIDRKTVNRIENDHFSPNVDTLLRITTALDVKPELLFREVTL